MVQASCAQTSASLACLFAAQPHLSWLEGRLARGCHEGRWQVQGRCKAMYQSGLALRRSLSLCRGARPWGLPLQSVNCLCLMAPHEVSVTAATPNHRNRSGTACSSAFQAPLMHGGTAQQPRTRQSGRCERGTGRKSACARVHAPRWPLHGHVSFLDLLRSKPVRLLSWVPLEVAALRAIGCIVWQSHQMPAWVRGAAAGCPPTGFLNACPLQLRPLSHQPIAGRPLGTG